MERDDRTLSQLATKQNNDLEDIRGLEHERREELSRRFLEEKMNLKLVHEENMVCMKRRTEEDRQDYQTQLKKQFMLEQAAEIETIKTTMMEERDEQIDLVIRKLDEETGQASRAAANHFQQQIKEMEVEQNRERKAIRNSETSWMDKCTHLSNTLEVQAGRLDVCGRRKEEIERKHSELEIELVNCQRTVQTALAKLRKEHAQARLEDVRRQESLERTVVQLERKVEECSDEQAMVVGEERRRRSQELDQVHMRVKETIARKDDMIVQLQEELRTSRMQTEHATEMLERQREELLAE